MHDVRVDQLVSVQRLVWNGHEVQREIRQAVPRGRIQLQAANRGDREVCGQRGLL